MQENVGETQSPFNPADICADIKQCSIEYVLSLVRNGIIDLSTGFGRWKEEDQSRLIESLLIRIPIPAFYFDITEDERWLVIDGVQRLTAMARFVLDDQTLKKLNLERLKLYDLEFLTDLNGSQYADLDRRFRRRINETSVTICTLEPGAPSEVRYIIFKRILTTVILPPLSHQKK